MLAAVADGIVTAAEGKALRVAVAGSPSRLAFAGLLTRALHARGRACRCLTPAPETDRAAEQGADGSTIAMIVGEAQAAGDGEAQAAGDGEVCGVSIRITERPREAGPSPASRVDESHRDGGPDSEDIVLDYSDPHGPSIRQFSVPGVGPMAPPAALVEGGE
ncbi:hypothetical protein ONA70_19685 [Micromonospora yasonensis]|uniref:hypothetical protein n=1 Tax=Micromonospora yasonensis TaxID=1128667 RepID=UPI0022314374|nr:hypothetical protein [Micromonospora yasonensis]MCW3842324.1 hypothetical protein [Micromonospora yasonensis]